MVKINKRLIILIFIFIFIVIIGIILSRKNKNSIDSSDSSRIINQNNICGGWDSSGEIICECKGHLLKPQQCPKDSVCDGESYYCNGTCGKCCYKGIAENSKYPKC